jgi:putative ABC transport system ATP-binding protein
MTVRVNTLVVKAVTSAPLSVQVVSKTYETGHLSRNAVRNVSLDFCAGQLTALMGPSGSGKTTLLSLMGGILRPTSGRVLICGTDVSTMNEAERSRVRLALVCFVFQSYNLFPSLSALQNVEVVLDLKGLRGIDRRREAARLLEEVELGSHLNQYPSDLSGGQQQRVAIARALAGSPKILLADEPTAALDSLTGRRVMKAFHGLARSMNCAVVVVTHDTRVAEFADRVLEMEDGRLVTDQPNRPSASLLEYSNTRPLKPALNLGAQ